jgi:surfactin synthase thioesterase subunit
MKYGLILCWCIAGGGAISFRPWDSLLPCVTSIRDSRHQIDL